MAAGDWNDARFYRLTIVPSVPHRTASVNGRDGHESLSSSKRSVQPPGMPGTTRDQRGLWITRRSLPENKPPRAPHPYAPLGHAMGPPGQCRLGGCLAAKWSGRARQGSAGSGRFSGAFGGSPRYRHGADGSHGEGDRPGVSGCSRCRDGSAREPRTTPGASQAITVEPAGHVIRYRQPQIMQGTWMNSRLSLRRKT